MNKIYLTGKYSNNSFSIVDTDIFEIYGKMKWWAKKGRKDKLYAFNNIGYLHRLILKAKKGNFVDHINGDTLDNRKCNLRICSIKENARNRGKQINNKSGYKGVYLSISKRQKTPMWRSQIQFNSILINIGCFKTKEEAYRAYCLKSKELFGEFSYHKL